MNGRMAQNTSQFSKLSSEIIQGCHGSHTFCSALSSAVEELSPILMMAAIKSC